MTDQGARLREALTSRVLVADGAMGTMLQANDLTLDDFEGHEGCNEILNVTRPDVVQAVHDAYFFEQPEKLLGAPLRPPRQTSLATRSEAEWRCRGPSRSTWC